MAEIQNSFGTVWTTGKALMMVMMQITIYLVISWKFYENFHYFWIIHRRIAETLNLFFPKYTAKNLDGLLLYTVLVMQSKPFFLVGNRSDFPKKFH